MVLQLLLDELTEAYGGEVTPEWEESWNKHFAGLTERVEATVMAVRNLERSAGAVGAEIERLQARKQVFTNTASRLKDHIRHHMEAVEVSKVKTDLFTVRVQQSPPTARYIGETDELPPSLQRVKIEFDARKAIECWKAEEELPTGVSVTRGTHLVIA